MRQTWMLVGDPPPDAIYSSPSRRAVESAALRGACSPAMRIEECLREIDFGELEGLTYHDIELRYPETYAAWMTRPTDVTFPGGESFASMTARARGALEHIRRTHAGNTVVIVSHGGVNRVALAAALDLEPPRIFRLAQAYACINVIDYLDDEPLVRVVNATFQAC